jgi:hypothetical protein
MLVDSRKSGNWPAVEQATASKAVFGTSDTSLARGENDRTEDRTFRSGQVRKTPEVRGCPEWHRKRGVGNDGGEGIPMLLLCCPSAPLP